MKNSIAVIAVALLLTFGCTVPPVQPLPHDHPANPAAPESEERFAGTLVEPPEPASAATPSSGKYVCPMHDEVTSDAPGSCPICGMKLIQKNERHP